MWIDATVAASFVSNPKDSRVADKVGFALAPNTGLGKNANWLWAWNLAIPAGSKKVEAAEKFIAWATGKDYASWFASKEGWANVPPGTRTSLYQNPEYLKVAPFAKLTLRRRSMRPIRTSRPCSRCRLSACNTLPFRNSRASAPPSASSSPRRCQGQAPVDAALSAAQSATEREMKRAGYIK